MNVKKRQIFFLLLFVFCKVKSANFYRLDWHPTSDYLAVSKYVAAGADNILIYSFDRQTKAITLADSLYYGNNSLWSVAWRPDGDFLAVGGSANGVKIYGFNDSTGKFTSGTPVATGVYGASSTVWDVKWSSTGGYLAVGGSSPSGDFGTNELGVYAFNGTSLSVTDSRNVDADIIRELVWHSQDLYLFASGQITAASLGDLLAYKFDSSTGSFVGSSPVSYIEGGTVSRTIDIHNSDKYIATGWQTPNNDYLLQLYKWDGVFSPNPIDYKTYGSSAVYCVRFSNDGRYLSVVGQVPDSGDELQIYEFDEITGSFSDEPIASFSFYATKSMYGTEWTPDDRFLGVCGADETLTSSFSCFKDLGLTRYDGTIYNVYFDDNIVLYNGDNAKGNTVFSDGFTVAYGETVSYGATVVLDITSPVSNSIDLRFSGTLDLLSDLILDSNFVFSSGGTISARGNTIFLNGNLTIEDDSVVKFSNDAVIDGQGHDLILGNSSQLLVDGGATLTLKNLLVKNSYNTISNPPIRCMNWYSNLCLDNVELSLNDDFAFNDGCLFIHNDVEVSGASKFSYRSVRPGYITQNANLLFSPQTTFEYYPSTTNNSLIEMYDEISKICFDNATLQTTHTGIRLTTGSVYLDNKVTLSTASITSFYDLNSLVTQGFGTFVNSVDWSSDGRYLAVAGINGATDLVVYSWNGSSLSLIVTLDFGTRANAVHWSPDGKYLAVGGENSSADLVVFSWDGTSLLEMAILDFGNRVYSVNWSPDGKYLAVGGDNGTQDLIIYDFHAGILSEIVTQDFSGNVYGVSWHPSGEYLVVAGINTTTNLIVYGWNGSSLSSLATEDFSSYSNSVDWSPDGRYLAVGGSNGTKDLIVYGWNGSSLNEIATKDAVNWISSSKWSPDGKYLVVGLYNSTSDLVVYDWDGENLNELLVETLDSIVASIDWTSDGKYLALGKSNLIIYENLFKFDTTPQVYFNGIIWGNSSLGSDYNLGVHLNAGSRVELYGKLWDDSLNTIDFANKNSFIVLSDENSKFKISDNDAVTGWRQTAIISGIAENSLFLTNDYEWIQGGNYVLSQEAFELINDFAIPDYETVYVTTDMVIDGHGNNLSFGHQSNFYLDPGVTLTLKNMKLKNSDSSKISPYPFQVQSESNRIVLQNLEFGLNGNFSFTKGGLFFHDSVKITGSSEFIYSSPNVSFITENSCLFFDTGTSFYYNQSGVSTNMELIIMQDKTSDLYLDGATLRTTDTGLKLTKGRLFLDNKVTLSSYLQIPQTYSNGIIFGDSTRGENYNLSVYILSAARLEVFGNLWNDNL